MGPGDGDDIPEAEGGEEEQAGRRSRAESRGDSDEPEAKRPRVMTVGIAPKMLLSLIEDRRIHFVDIEVSEECAMRAVECEKSRIPWEKMEGRWADESSEDEVKDARKVSVRLDSTRCEGCKEECGSRNKLFKHLRQCMSDTIQEGSDANGHAITDETARGGEVNHEHGMRPPPKVETALRNRAAFSSGGISLRYLRGVLSAESCTSREQVWHAKWMVVGPISTVFGDRASLGLSS